MSKIPVESGPPCLMFSTSFFGLSLDMGNEHGRQSVLVFLKVMHERKTENGGWAGCFSQGSLC